MLATGVLSSPLKLKSSPWGSEWEQTPTCGEPLSPLPVLTRSPSVEEGLLCGRMGGWRWKDRDPLPGRCRKRNERVLDGLRLGVQGNQRRQTRME